MIASARTRIARSEDGIAIVVAMGAMLVLLLLTATVLAAATQLNSSVNRDQDAKLAFQAAEGGLDTAMYRLNANPSYSATSFSVSTGNRGTAAVTIGAIATSATGACAGQAVTVGSRCVTSAGTVDGVTRRVQARLVTSATSLFPVNGLLGLNRVTANNGVRIYTRNGSTTTGNMGSNGQVEIRGAVDNDLNIGLGPGAPEPIIGNRNRPVTVTRNPAAYALADVNVGTTRTSNINGVWTRNGGTATASGTREITFDNGDIVFTQSGDYNYCNFTVNNTSTFRFSNRNIKVRFYIDSGPGSGCAANKGQFKIINGINIANNNVDGSETKPDQFQLYVVGASSAPAALQPAVDINNSGTQKMFIYAPTSDVLFRNSQNFTGGIAARTIEFQNAFDFYWDASATPPSGAGSNYGRASWRECQSSGSTCL